MTTTSYSHFDVIGNKPFRGGSRGISIDGDPQPSCPDPLGHALLTMQLARALGIAPSSASIAGPLPYSDECDNLTFDAPLASLALGRRIKHLRGWKQFESCIKGFNALGLMAEHVGKELVKLDAMSGAAAREIQIEFLKSRTRFSNDGEQAAAVFSDADLARTPSGERLSLDPLPVAIWRAFADRTIVCSTSSNMGISLHEALRYMQKTRLCWNDREFSILNRNEGKLIIWCPDEKADFMNREKAETLRSLENEEPALTILRTYINRQQRDPGALQDALQCGGYFFPTNPQSREEMQNLFSISLADIMKARRASLEEVLNCPMVTRALESLDAEIGSGRVVIKSGVEGGLYGLIVPYLILLEESLQKNDVQAMATWCPASIGAALAAAVLADIILREPERISAGTRAELEQMFPLTARAIRKEPLGASWRTSIHGTFDTSNLQSIAQLFAVIVDRHLSGRGTAYVGLGSSSYANGNRIYDILKESADKKGAFRGRDSLHPATHTVNPVAQALIYTDDFYRIISSASFAKMEEIARVGFLVSHVKKPEPAGAASLAGYLLARLDQRSLSFVELAFVLRLAGFTAKRFLEFSDYEGGEDGAVDFIRTAHEEGQYMGKFAENILTALDWDAGTLEELSRIERAHSRLNYLWTPFDADFFEQENPAVVMYLTGDNTTQPGEDLVEKLLLDGLGNLEAIKRVLDTNHGTGILSRKGAMPFRFFKSAFKASSGLLNRLHQNHESIKETTFHALVKIALRKIGI